MVSELLWVNNVAEQLTQFIKAVVVSSRDLYILRDVLIQSLHVQLISEQQTGANHDGGRTVVSEDPALTNIEYRLHVATHSGDHHYVGHLMLQESPSEMNLSDGGEMIGNMIRNVMLITH